MPLSKIYFPNTSAPLNEAHVNDILIETRLPILPSTDRICFAQELGRCRRIHTVISLFNRRARRQSKLADSSVLAVAAVLNAIPTRLVPDDVSDVLRNAADTFKSETEKSDFSVPASAAEWLVAVYLTAIFERAFGRPAKISNHATTQKAAGPFVRFAIATLAANGLRYSPASVKTAFDRAGGARGAP
jgi:hypothetical protein